MHDDSAVIGTWIPALRIFDDLNEHFESEVTVDMDMNLPIVIPVSIKSLAEIFWFHHPFTVVMRVGLSILIEIRIGHLHELADDRAIAKQLHVAVEHRNFATRASFRNTLFRLIEGVITFDMSDRLGSPLNHEG